jgi:hypothetical protein
LLFPHSYSDRRSRASNKREGERERERERGLIGKNNIYYIIFLVRFYDVDSENSGLSKNGITIMIIIQEPCSFAVVVDVKFYLLRQVGQETLLCSVIQSFHIITSVHNQRATHGYRCITDDYGRAEKYHKNNVIVKSDST